MCSVYWGLSYRYSLSAIMVWIKSHSVLWDGIIHEPLARYVKLREAHAQALPETISSPSRVSDPDMHHGTCATHVPWCMPGSLTGGFLWSHWRVKHSRHSRRMRNPQVCVSGKRPIDVLIATAVYLSDCGVRAWILGSDYSVIHDLNLELG